MNQNLQKLTDKIYQEGIEKAEADGQEIVEQAKQKARQIIAEAEAKAQRMVDRADHRAKEIKKTSEAEMRLAIRQSMGALKQRIVDLIVAEILTEPIEQAFKDESFIKRLIEKMIEHWAKDELHDEHLEILLPEKDRQDLGEFFRFRGNEYLKKGVSVKFTGKMKDGFQIQPEGGRFRISFTSEDFENYFKTFIRPRSFEILFGPDE